MDGDWADLPIDLNLSRGATLVRIGNLPNGTASGAPALQLAIQLPDGRVITAETTWRLMRSALRAIDAAWPGWD